MTAWTDHVRKKASELGISYNCATTDPRVKNTFDYSSTPGKATRAPRKSRAKKGTAMTDDGYVVALDMDSKERRQLAKRRMLEVMGGNPFTREPPAPKKRKPMSEETKAMLKERRAMKKADRVYSVSEKFDAFWNRHEGIPAGGPLAGSGVRTATLAQVAKDAAQSAIDRVAVSEKRAVASAITESIADMVGGAVSTMPVKKKRNMTGESWKRKKMTPEAMARLNALKEEKKARKKGSKMKPPKKPTGTLTPLSADDMALAFNLLN